MTSNLVECFNNVLKGVRSLLVIAIVEYTIFKLNEYFQSHSEKIANWIGMASSGTLMRPPCTDQEDMPKKWMEDELDKTKEKDVSTPPCWCGDVCKVKVSIDRKKEWTEGRRFFLPPPLCNYFTWIDEEVPQHVQEDQYRDAMWRQRLFNESLACEEERECREKENKERKKRDEEKKRKEKQACQEERARKLSRARDAQVEDEALDKKGKWPCTTQ
ncbi:hypothetical protein D1007_11368 [Hordeum vulgare]|nr:hypothetical protein D1007_11368 [Hordeum vulgare]